MQQDKKEMDLNHPDTYQVLYIVPLLPAAATRTLVVYAFSSANSNVDDSAYEPKLMFIIVAPLLMHTPLQLQYSLNFLVL